MTNSELKLSLVYTDLCAALSSLKCGMACIAPEEFEKRLEHLRYCEKVIETAKERVKELKK